MTSAIGVANERLEVVVGETRKLPAFLRRDFLVAWSYRMAFVSDLLALVGQAFLFYFIGLLVDSSKLPTFGGTEVTYLEFAAIGIAVGLFIHFALERVAGAIRGEQFMGTLESVLVTPTARATVQLGSVVFDLVYIPVRTAVFLAAIALAFGLHLEPSGILPATALLLAFIPFIWGVGVASAGAILTFRGGSGAVSMGTMALALVSGLYFPLELLPRWLADVARHNPVALVGDGMREALLGGAGWTDVAPSLLALAPMSACSLILGMAIFRLAVRRERRLGTLGLY